MKFFFHYQLIFFTVWTASCHWFFALWLVSIHSCWMIFLGHSKFFSSDCFFHYGPYLLVHNNQNKFSASSETFFSNFRLHIAVASMKVMKFLAHRAYWLHLFLVALFWLMSQSTLCCLFEDLSVWSKYCSTTLLESKRSSAMRVSLSTNAINFAKLGSLLLRFLIADTCWFYLSLICHGNFVISEHSVSGESRAFQVWLDVTLWHFSRKLSNFFSVSS